MGETEFRNNFLLFCRFISYCQKTASIKGNGSAVWISD